MNAPAAHASDLIVAKQHIDRVELVPARHATLRLDDDQIRVRVDRIGLTSNNLSYAAAGDALGYWQFFPTDDPARGIVPAWGFATVVESRHGAITVGEEIFGLLPMGSHLVLQPTAATATTFSDRFEHRAGLHPWYNRYYRTATDPATVDRFRHLQPVYWPLHMTGWMLAREFNDHRNFDVDHIFVASASSKTAVAFAKSMEVAHRGSELVGLTSEPNAPFVEALGCYDRVLCYEDLDVSADSGRAALVDMSGNSSVVATVHHAFGEGLTQSIRVGATHLGARGDTSGLPGATRRFFFIPDVAEAHAATVGFATHHAAFASALGGFLSWVDAHTTVVERSGPDALRDAYLAALAGRQDPAEATIVTF